MVASKGLSLDYQFCMLLCQTFQKTAKRFGEDEKLRFPLHKKMKF